MSRKARIRAAAASAVALAIGLAFATGAIQGAWASFQAETQNTNAAYAGGWVNPATSLNASPSGYGANFGWTPVGTGTSPYGALSSQQLIGVDHNSTNNCTSVTYANIGAALSATATSTSDAESSAVNGHYFCYEMRDYAGANNWFTDAAFSPSPIQLGFIPTGISFSNGGTAGKIDQLDVITITFNQAVSSSSIPVSTCKPPGFSSNQTNCMDVCVNATGNTVFLGDTSNCSNASDGYSIGKLTGFTVGGAKQNFNQSLVTVSGSTVTISLEPNHSSGGVSGAATFTASSTGITSSAGSANACTSATYSCTPTSTGSF